MERVRITDMDFRNRISWGSIFAGVVTVLAISILLSLLGSSIGLFMLDPKSSHPASGVGTTVGIWTIVSLLISLAAGGFVAGKLAGRDGIIHGFVVWATSMIATVILVGMLAVSAVRMTANLLGSVSSVVGNVIGGVGSAVGSGASALVDEAKDVFGDIDFSDDTDGTTIRQDIRQALKRNGVREFQPEYLQSQMNAVKSDMQKSVKRLATHPNDAENIIDDFLEKVKERTDDAFKDVNRDDLTKAIANNSKLSKAEVDRAADEYIELFDNAREKAKEQINNLQTSVENAKQDWERLKEEARIEADKATNAAARSALFSFIGMLIGAAVAAFLGMYGARKTQEGYEV